MERQTVEHTFDPVYDESSRVLILGTMPSPKSRENGFYYSHPQNRFWRILSDIFSVPLPVTVGDKRRLLAEKRIALWDVLRSCAISGADDSSIREPVPNDIGSLLESTNISCIFTTGRKAYSLYNRFCLKDTGVEAVCLPSTSPANCALKYEDILEQYRSALCSTLNDKEADR